MRAISLLYAHTGRHTGGGVSLLFSAGRESIKINREEREGGGKRLTAPSRLTKQEEKEEEVVFSWSKRRLKKTPVVTAQNGVLAAKKEKKILCASLKIEITFFLCPLACVNFFPSTLCCRLCLENDLAFLGGGREEKPWKERGRGGGGMVALLVT